QTDLRRRAQRDRQRVGSVVTSAPPSVSPEGTDGYVALGRHGVSTSAADCGVADPTLASAALIAGSVASRRRRQSQCATDDCTTSNQTTEAANSAIAPSTSFPPLRGFLTNNAKTSSVRPATPNM